MSKPKRFLQALPQHQVATKYGKTVSGFLGTATGLSTASGYEFIVIGKSPKALEAFFKSIGEPNENYDPAATAAVVVIHQDETDLDRARWQAPHREVIPVSYPATTKPSDDEDW